MDQRPTTMTIPVSLTVPEAAEAAHVCAETIRRWIRSGQLHARSVAGGPENPHGHRWRIHAVALWAFLERR